MPLAPILRLIWRKDGGRLRLTCVTHFVDVVLNQREQKGTGRRTVENGLDLGVPITGIAEPTFVRSLSGWVSHCEAAV
jgi:6-phosphogluconate dehydrogenase